VNQLVVEEKVETDKQRVGKLAEEREAESLKLVLLDELVEVHAEQLKGDACVITKLEMVVHQDNVGETVLILTFEMIQDSYFLLHETR